VANPARLTTAAEIRHSKSVFVFVRVGVSLHHRPTAFLADSFVLSLASATTKLRASLWGVCRVYLPAILAFSIMHGYSSPAQLVITEMVCNECNRLQGGHAPARYPVVHTVVAQRQLLGKRRRGKAVTV